MRAWLNTECPGLAVNRLRIVAFVYALRDVMDGLTRASNST